MNNFKPSEYKAIEWYQNKNSLHVQLSRYPWIYFLDDSGVEHKRHIEHMLLEWNAWRKEEKRNKGA